MEAMVILWSKAEDAQSPALVPLCIFRIASGKKTLNGEVSSLHPDGLCGVKRIEHNTSTVSRRCDDLWSLRRRARSRLGLKCPVEELVEVAELLDGQENLGHVKLVEGDEAGDLSSRGRIVVLLALLDAEGFEKFLDCGAVSVYRI
jgi:hypothetical protein